MGTPEQKLRRRRSCCCCIYLPKHHQSLNFFFSKRKQKNRNKNPLIFSNTTKTKCQHHPWQDKCPGSESQQDGLSSTMRATCRLIMEQRPEVPCLLILQVEPGLSTNELSLFRCGNRH